MLFLLADAHTQHGLCFRLFAFLFLVFLSAVHTILSTILDVAQIKGSWRRLLEKPPWGH